MTTKADLQAIAETHERPFLIIDKDSVIVAANRAFLKAYGASLPEILNRPCYEVTHKNPRPCYEMGEECPIQRIQETGEPHACLHVHTHLDRVEHVHQVRVKGFPLRFEDGDLYYGELFEELAVHTGPEEDPQHMIGSSTAFLASIENMKKVAGSDAPVLIQGETGTGKELAASFVHRNSRRANGPFLTLDCTVLTETLVESELFGHARGAFTGSVGDRQGLFKLADGGTLFLDEIGELPKPLQTKLLRVLESGEFRRVGSDTPIRTDVRIVCATNRDLAMEVRNGAFREDLYYRLACLTVQLPSLRERREDIRDLSELMLHRSTRNGELALSLTEGAIETLKAYDFPGNVRELRNILQAASAHANGVVVDRSLIERTISGSPMAVLSKAQPEPAAGERPATPTGNPPCNASLQDVECEHLKHLLRVHGGDRAAIAESLGVSVRTVYRKLKRHRLG
jgi:transcriptional regulator with PAS, ATPase and Fis domain